MKISELKPNPNNPRKIEPDKLDKLVDSIRTFPEMMSKRPMVCVTDVDGKLYPLGGNQRLKAITTLKMKEIPDNWVILADEWTIEQRNEFLIKDNLSVGEWDWEMLANEWDVDELSEWGLDIPQWAAGIDENNMTDEDVDLEEEFDPIGSASDLMKIVFIFDNELEAETFMSLHHKEQEYKKTCGPAGKIWQVNLSENYGKK